MAAGRIECAFIVPLVQDARIGRGVSHLATSWAWLEEQLEVLAGGFHVAGKVRGVWRSPQAERIEEEGVKYVVAVAEEDLDRLRALLRAAAVLFAQEAMYLAVGGRVDFVGEEP